MAGRVNSNNKGRTARYIRRYLSFRVHSLSPLFRTVAVQFSDQIQKGV